MSLTRLALRLSAIAAVKASPALAGTDVHDTGWSKFDRIGAGDYRPVLIISTEDVAVEEEVSRHESDRRVDMLVQIALATVDGALAEIAPDDWDTAEALIDIIEQEIDWALERDPVWSGLVQHVERNSTTVRDASGANKMPMRLMVLSCRVFAVCVPPPAVAPDVPAQGLARFGADIAAIVGALPEGDRVRAVVENAAGLTLAEQVGRLRGFKVTARRTDAAAARDTPALEFGVSGLDLPDPEPEPDPTP
ncbi:hypothetical protein ABE438_17410 [Bosea sp. TWI1241]|uniref:hypothetical protein n=1 Tax=Bosea sp. TWI1241 TaxID=3148904 RepID=UPI00320B2AE9